MKSSGTEQSRQNRSDLERKVVAFLEGEICDRRVDLDMDIRRDLGIDGDDAADLLQRFSDTFGVDFGGFRFSDYFGPEAGFEPITWLLSKLSRSAKRLEPFKVRALVDAAERGCF